MKDNQIKVLSDRDHVLLRPAMYLGSVNTKLHEDFFLEDDSISHQGKEYVPALVKMFGEVFDNAVDEAIRTNFEYATDIRVKITSDSITIKDTGRGIPVELEESTGEYGPVLAWGQMKAGSNFEDDDTRMTAGMNGVGASVVNIFSTKFKGETSDGQQKLVYTSKDNMDSNYVKVTNSSLNYTQVTFHPDFSRLECDVIDDVTLNVMKQRVLIASIMFPDISFRFNNKKIHSKSPKHFINLFGKGADVLTGGDGKWFVGVIPNDNDDFRFFSYVNALHMKDGGTHIDNISYNIVNRLKDKLIRKHKGIKPGDIRNKMQLVVFFRDFPKFETNSQTKESLSNSASFIREYMGDVDWDSFVYKLAKNKLLIDPITEVFRIKEEFKKRQELKKLDKVTKRIKSEKYFPAIGGVDKLYICEGTSARVGLMKILGRRGNSFYELKGVPLNAVNASQQKFTANKELSELYKIINNVDFNRIVIATDADLDGNKITGLLFGFFITYMPDVSVSRLRTPLMVLKKGDKVIKWAYDMTEINSWTEVDMKGCEAFYVKGLGSWRADQLRHVINIDGLDNMIDNVIFDDNTIITSWLSSNTSDIRKEYVLANEFSIAKL